MSNSYKPTESFLGSARVKFNNVNIGLIHMDGVTIPPILQKIIETQSGQYGASNVQSFFGGYEGFEWVLKITQTDKHLLSILSDSFTVDGTDTTSSGDGTAGTLHLGSTPGKRILPKTLDIDFLWGKPDGTMYTADNTEFGFHFYTAYVKSIGDAVAKGDEATVWTVTFGIQADLTKEDAKNMGYFGPKAV